MSRNFLKEIVLELRYERQNGCGYWEGVLGRGTVGRVPGVGRAFFPEYKEQEEK